MMTMVMATDKRTCPHRQHQLFDVEIGILGVVNSYLDIPSILAFDSAVTNHDARPIWLSVLKITEAKSLGDYQRHSPLSLRWLGSRRPCVGNIVIPINCTAQALIASLANVLLPSVFDVRINCSGVNDHFMKVMAPCFPEMRELRIDDIHDVTDSGMRAIAINCPSLETMLFTKMSLISDEGMSAIVQNCSLLTKIDIDGDDMSEDMTGDWMLELSSGCRDLEELSIRGLPITDLSLEAISGCHNLKYLSLECGNAAESPEQIASVDGYKALARGCPKLHTIQLGTTSLTDHVMSVIADNWPNLEQLTVVGDSVIGDEGLRIISTRLPMLQALTLYGELPVTDAGLLQLASTKCLLKDLSVDLSHATSNGLIAMFEGLGKGLRSLTLFGSNTAGDDVPSNVNDEVAHNISLCCPKLNDITFFCCDQLTTAAVESLIFKCALLKKVTVAPECSLVTDEMLGKLRDQYPWVTLNRQL